MSAVDPKRAQTKQPELPLIRAEVEGIPIAAKFKGPGPVYSLPPTIGINAKYIGQRAPAFSFGVKIPMRLHSIGPGPAAFTPHKIGRAPPAYSLGRRWDNEKEFGNAKLIPGPGQYNPAPNNKASPKFSFRQKHSEYEHFVPDSEQGNNPFVL